MRRTPSIWLSLLALVAIATAAPVHHAAAQLTTPNRTDRPTTEQGRGGLSAVVTTQLPSAARVYNLPTITYGEPMSAPPASLTLRGFDARIPLVDSVNVTANVGGRSVSRPLVVLNGREGIESAPIREDARRLLDMHTRKLDLNESTVYFYDPAVAVEWLATHEVPECWEPSGASFGNLADDGLDALNDAAEEIAELVEASDEFVIDCGNYESDDDGGSGCGIQNFGNCVQDPVGAVQDAVEATVAEIGRAQDRWDDAAEDIADAWNEALNCFSDHILPGGTVPLRFDIAPTMTVNLSQSGARGSGTGTASGSVGLGIPMRGDLQAKVDFFYIPCLPFIVRPRSITVTGDLTVGERLSIDATAEGAFERTYTIPPTGGPRIPIQVIPIIIGGVPVAIIDVSVYIDGEVTVAGDGSVTGNFTLSNEHRTTFDVECSGNGCQSGDGGAPTTSTPVTTTESVQVEGKVSAKPGIYTALMLTLNGNVLGARVGPQPYLLGTAMGCGAATATQTDGGNSTGEQNAALIADLDWGVDVRAEALVGGKVLENDFRDSIIDPRHIWYSDLVPGGSSALRTAIAGPSEAATGQPAVYKLRMPSCYPYEEAVKYRVSWTGSAQPTAVPATACDWEVGSGSCDFDPARELELRFAWPTAGTYSLAAVLVGDEHQTFEPRLPSTELAVSVTGETVTSSGDGGAAGRAAAATTVAAGGRAASTADSGCCDIVPNPDMRGRLGRVVIAYPEEVSARVDIYRPGETPAVASGYGDVAFDLFPGTYEVEISGKRVTGVTVRSGNDTRIRVGVLRVNASDSTRIDLVEGADGRSLTSGYGTDVYGLPIGEVGVRIADQTEVVVIEAGKVAEF